MPKQKLFHKVSFVISSVAGRHHALTSVAGGDLLLSSAAGGDHDLSSVAGGDHNLSSVAVVTTIFPVWQVWTTF